MRRLLNGCVLSCAIASLAAGQTRPDFRPLADDLEAYPLVDSWGLPVVDDARARAIEGILADGLGLTPYGRVRLGHASGGRTRVLREGTITAHLTLNARPGISIELRIELDGAQFRVSGVRFGWELDPGEVRTAYPIEVLPRLMAGLQRELKMIESAQWRVAQIFVERSAVTPPTVRVGYDLCGERDSGKRRFQFSTTLELGARGSTSIEADLACARAALATFDLDFPSCVLLNGHAWDDGSYVLLVSAGPDSYENQLAHARLRFEGDDAFVQVEDTVVPAARFKACLELAVRTARERGEGFVALGLGGSRAHGYLVTAAAEDVVSAQAAWLGVLEIDAADAPRVATWHRLERGSTWRSPYRMTWRASTPGGVCFELPRLRPIFCAAGVDRSARPMKFGDDAAQVFAGRATLPHR